MPEPAGSLRASSAPPPTKISQVGGTKRGERGPILGRGGGSA